MITRTEKLFTEPRMQAHVICALGHGDPAKAFQRNPRLDFDEACRLA